MSGDYFYAERYHCTGVSTCRESAEPVPPSAPAMTDNSPLQAVDVVFLDDAISRLPDEEIEGRCGEIWDYTVADDDSELDDLSACQHARLAAALCTEVVTDHPSELQSNGGDCFACASSAAVLFESSSPPAPDDASVTARTYDDITKSPPPHLRCVVSPRSSLLPILRCTTASQPFFSSPTSQKRVQAVLCVRLPLGCLVLDI